MVHWLITTRSPAPREGFRAWWRGLFAAVILVAWPTVVPAQAVQVTPLGCEHGLHVTARNARLSQVLKQMSSALGFSLSFWSAEDPLISFDGRVQSLQLVRVLAQQANIMFSTIPDPRCAGQERLQSVWVIPGGAGGVAQPVRRPSAPAASTLSKRQTTSPGLAPPPVAPVPPEEDSSTN